MMNIVRTTKRGKKVTTAIVTDCEMDAVRRIHKRFFANEQDDCCPKCCGIPHEEVAIINDKFISSVRLADGDEYSEELGESLAVKKNMEKHQNAFKKAIVRWQVAMLKDIKRVQPETFEEAFNKVK